MVEHQKSLLDTSPTSSSSLGSNEDPVIATPVPTPTAPHEDSVLYSNNPPIAVLAPPSLDGVDANNNNTNSHNDQQRVVGAGVAGGVLGFLLGGPILGTLAGFGAAYVCKKEPHGSAAGDVARAMGDVALSARDQALELNNKHNFTGATQEAAQSALTRAQEYERQHQVLNKTRDFVQFSWQKVKDINREHRVVERAMTAMGQAIKFVIQKLAGKEDDDDENGQGGNENDNRGEARRRRRGDYTEVSDAEPQDKTSCDAQPF